MAFKVDFHVHPVLVEELHRENPKLSYGVREVYGLRTGLQPLRMLVRQLKAFGVSRAVVLGLDLSRLYGVKVPSNEEVGRLTAEYPGFFVGFGGVDPLKGDEAIGETERLARSGFKGVKIDPCIQRFRVDEEGLTGFYETLESLGLTLLVHTGFSWAPESRLEYGYPLLIEKVASRFRELNIVLAHMGWPWLWEAVCLAVKYENVYLDTADTFTGTAKEHFRRVFVDTLGVRFVESFLKYKIVFGSNHPRMESGKILEALNSLPLSLDVKECILGLNACRILGLEEV